MKKNRNTWDLQHKLVLTFGLLTLSRVGVFISIPGVAHDALHCSVSSGLKNSFLNTFFGGGFASVGIFGLGSVPYLNISILVQLCISLIPSFEQWQKESGDIGKKQLAQITRLMTLCWAVIQSFGVAFWIRKYALVWSVEFVMETVLALTTGCMLLMWIADQITAHGVGNGTSLLIFTNILSDLPKLFQNRITSVACVTSTLEVVVLFFMLLFAILGIIFMQEGTRKIPLVSVKHIENHSSHPMLEYLPLKMQHGGVMPILFASILLTAVTHLSQMISTFSVRGIVDFLLSSRIYPICYFLLILFFGYVSSSLFINPVDLSKNLKRMEFVIPGVKPGEATQKYLQKTLRRLTFLGALFLACIAIIPILLESMTKIALFKNLNATSLLILVGVAIDTSKYLQLYLKLQDSTYVGW